MSEATFTFRVDETLKAAFNEAARSQDQTSAQLLRAFMRDYVRQSHVSEEYDAWFRGAVAVGLDQAERGETIAAEEVEAVFAARREETRQSLAGIAR